jgi:hypothetical protein
MNASQLASQYQDIDKGIQGGSNDESRLLGASRYIQ